MTRERFQKAIPKIRKSWIRNPKTQVKPNDKIYFRPRDKKIKDEGEEKE